MRRYTLHHQLFRLLHLLILPALYVLTRLAAGSPAAVESAYSNTVYPVIRNAISAVSRTMSFSIAEFLIISGIAAIVIFLIVRVVRAIFIRKAALIKLLSLIITYVLMASYLAFAFYVVWGFNYFRPDIGTRLDLPRREYSTGELEALCYELAGHAAELRASVDEDENGVFKFDIERMKDSVLDAVKGFGNARPSFQTDAPKVKSVYFSEFLSSCGISGIFIPFTEEPNINVHEPCLYIPFSAAHETSHYIGYAREEDANFLAFLITKDANDPALAYSGYMHALVNCANRLAASDREAYMALRETYTEGMKRDLADYSNYLMKYSQTKLRQTMDDLNDSYLKLNDQEKGVLSYEEDVALILRYYDSQRFFERQISVDVYH